MATTVGAAGYSSQQPNAYGPEFQSVTTPVRIWGTTGNTDTVFDASIHPSSGILITPTASPTGFWKVVVSQGQFIVTSSNAESAGLTYNYVIL